MMVRVNARAVTDDDHTLLYSMGWFYPHQSVFLRPPVDPHNHQPFPDENNRWWENKDWPEGLELPWDRGPWP